MRSAGGYAANVEACTTERRRAARLREAHPGRGARHPGHADDRDPRRRRQREAPAPRRPRLDRRRHPQERRARAHAPRRHARGRRRRPARRSRGRHEARRGAVRPGRGRDRRPTPTSRRTRCLVKGYIGPWSRDRRDPRRGVGHRHPVPASTRASPTAPAGSPAPTPTASTSSGSSPAATSATTAPSRSPRCRRATRPPTAPGPVELARGMEIGHVFQLGRKYAEALGLRCSTRTASSSPSRWARTASASRASWRSSPRRNNDEKGLIWPDGGRAVRRARHRDRQGRGRVRRSPSRLAADLEAAGLDVLYDDRPKVSPGVKFGDAELSACRRS